MNLRGILQLRFLSHPVHAMLAHFPVVLMPVVVVLDILSYTVGTASNAYVIVAYYTLLAGALLAGLAALSGWADFHYELRPNSRARTVGAGHAITMLIALVMVMISLGLRIPELGAGETPVAPFVLNIIGALIVLASSYIGGVLVFRYGARVDAGAAAEAARAAEHAGPLPPNVRRFPSLPHLRRRSK